MFRFLSRLFLFLLSLLGLLEVVFHLLIPARSLPRSLYLEKYQLAVSDRAKSATGVSTYGCFAQQRVTWRINNCGWNSDVDYVAPAERRSPLIALIGDSYIQGFSVQAADDIAARLRHHLGGTYAVYSFGRGGANLAHYGTIARYVQQEFDADVYVFFVVANDLTQSLYNLGSQSMATQLLYRDGRFEVLPLERLHSYTKEEKNSLLYRIVELRWLSGFYRYLIFHKSMTRLLFFNQDERQSVDEGPSPGAGDSREALLAQTADYLVQGTRQLLVGKRVILVVDAQRQEIYRTGGGSPVKPLPDSPYLRAACSRYGCEFIDLTETFRENYQARHLPFNFSFDYHWNEYGRDVIARRLAAHLQPTLRTLP